VFLEPAGPSLGPTGGSRMVGRGPRSQIVGSPDARASGAESITLRGLNHPKSRAWGPCSRSARTVSVASAQSRTLPADDGGDPRRGSRLSAWNSQIARRFPRLTQRATDRKNRVDGARGFAA